MSKIKSSLVLEILHSSW